MANKNNTTKRNPTADTNCSCPYARTVTIGKEKYVKLGGCSCSENMTCDQRELGNYDFGISGNIRNIKDKISQTVDYVKELYTPRDADAGIRDQYIGNPTEVYARVFYAIRDSLRMDAITFAKTYNATDMVKIVSGPKSGVLLDLDIGVPSTLGNVDLDSAMLFVLMKINNEVERKMYKVGRNLVRLKSPKFNLNYPAEKNARIMADAMLNGGKRFHDFFSQDLVKRAQNPNDPINKSFSEKKLIDVYKENY